jgi:hypothetical protein
MLGGMGSEGGMRLGWDSRVVLPLYPSWLLLYLRSCMLMLPTPN